MADRELVEAKYERREKAAEALESMFPGLGGGHPKSPSNVVDDFTAIDRFNETRFDSYTGKCQLRRSDHSDHSLSEYVLNPKELEGLEVGFSASDIRKVSVPECEVVIDPDYNGFPTIERGED